VTPVRPVYFRFMTLLSFHTFLTTPSLRAVILEVGIGGKYDSTNIVKTPVVCGVATLGLDHTALLGNTIEEIAEQKAGIYKKGRPALAVRQSKETAEAVLRRCAEEVKVSHRCSAERRNAIWR
jgi:folylpolyglutamate synthase